MEINNITTINQYTTPLQGRVHNRNIGVIKAVDFYDGSKYSVGEIVYEEYGEADFQYIFIPYWHVIDGLPSELFQGIPGLDMEARLSRYYRVNREPVFITQRTPSRKREGLWELLESVGLDYYDRLEWLIRTNMRAGNDNLIVERDNNCGVSVEGMESEIVLEYERNNDDSIQRFLAYAKKIKQITLTTKGDLGSSPREFNKNLLRILSSGNTISTQDRSFSVAQTEVPAMLKLLLAQKALDRDFRKIRQQEGILTAKEQGKYKGRKRIEVNKLVLKQTMEKFERKEIDLEEAMQLTGITSRSTFYRRRKEFLTETIF